MESDVPELESRLAAIGTAPDNAQARADALVELAWAIRSSERERSRQLATEARELSISIGYRLGQARAARTLCMTTTSPDMLRDVLAFADEAKTLFDEVGDPQGRAGARDFLAGIHEAMGEWSSGLELAFEALDIAREVGDPVRQGYALSNVGGIKIATGDVDGGKARWQEALDLFESVNCAHGIARICERFSQLYRSQGNLDAARDFAHRLLDAAGRGSDGDGSDRASALLALAEIEEGLGHFDVAERLSYDSIAAYTNEEIRGLAGTPAHLSLGRLLLRRGAFAEAEAEICQAIDALATYGVSSPAWKADALQLLANVSEQQGDLERTIERLREVAHLRERVAEDEARNRLARFEARAEVKAAQQETEIHRLKFVELAEMQSKLVEAEKMAQLGRFAAGTAHELNTPLGVLRSNLTLYAKAAERLSELATTDAGADARTQRLASAVSGCQKATEDAVARIAAVAESFRRFTSLDLAERRTFNLVEGLEAAMDLMRPNVPDRVTVRSHLAAVPDIDGWPGQLNQSFMTVLENATQAIDGEGVVSVETEADSDAVVVRIGDTGRGMSEAERASLFEIGWSAGGKRTKMRLGLPAARATVLRHGGSIEAQSAPGRGTVVVFRFPVGTTPVSRAPEGR